MIEITRDKIDTEKILRSVGSDQAGAAVLFVGTTRQFTNGKQTLHLDYDCYQEMALKKMEQLRNQASERWPIIHCAIVHRIGTVELGEASIAVAVSTAHRDASFESARWLIDTLKVQVPIWKQEHWSDGSTQWVHPDGSTMGSLPGDNN